MGRPATPDDIAEICGSFPESEFGMSWRDSPTWLVRGRGFVLHRRPHRSAVDPETGELYDDLLVIVTPTEIEKLALVEDPTTPFFTVDHFNGYAAVLVQESRLGEVDVDELRELLTDAWLTRAPKRLARAFLAEQESDG